MTLPSINVHDGKHKLIMAEDGERVLTPSQNKKYEAEHPNARMEPMKAQLYDLGGVIGGVENVIKKQTPAQKQAAINNVGQDTFQVHETPMMNQLYDKGGKVQNMPSITDRIASRAKELYRQGQALKAPLDNEAEAFQEKQRVLNEGATGQPQAPKPLPTIPTTAPAPTDLVHPAGASYGGRSGEQRIDTNDMLKPLGASAPIGKAYDCGGVVYDEGGDISEESDDPAKEAAYHQAASEVHAEEAQKHSGAPTNFGGPIIPNPKGIKVQSDTDMPESEKHSFMDISNPEKNQIEPAEMPEQEYVPGGGPMRPTEDGRRAPIMSEASNKTPLGPLVAPRPTQMKRLPLDVAPEAPKVKPEPEPVAPDLDAIIQKDKIDAAKRGHAGLADLGLAQIHENILGKKPEPTALGPELVPPTTELPPTGKGENAEAAKRDVAMKQLHEKMLYAPTEQERFQAEKDLAELKRKTPWGSPENHPGLGGKILHGVSSIAQGLARGVAPYVLPAIPGSKANLEASEARGEQGVEQAQEKELKAAQVGAAKAQPELAEAKIEAAEFKARMGDQQALFKGGAKRLDNGDVVPLTYEELPADSQAKIDLNNAKANYQDAFAEYRKYQADPNGPQAKALEEKMKSEAIRAGAAAGNLGLNKKKFMADYYGTDENGVALPGVERDEQGNPIGPKVAKGNETTSMRLNKADLSQNVQLNAKNAIDMITANPELFGKVAGRYTNTRQMAGSGDEAIKNLGIEVHNIAVASAGIHGQRGQAAVEAYEKGILNKFHDTPAATISGLNEISGSVQTFIDAAKSGKKVAPTPTAANEKPAAPAGATNEVLKDGKVIGHVVDGKYVALPKATK
jgi:hypothetical protein